MKTQPTHTPTPCKYCSCDLLDHNFDGSDKCHDIGTKYKTQTPHTPTPWKAWKAWEGFLVTDMNNRHIANLTDSTKMVGWQDAANAAFIVRAVNAYQPMVELLEHIARSVCLDQRKSDHCICFSCEAKRVLI